MKLEEIVERIFPGELPDRLFATACASVTPSQSMRVLIEQYGLAVARAVIEEVGPLDRVHNALTRAVDLAYEHSPVFGDMMRERLTPVAAAFNRLRALVAPLAGKE